MLRNVVRRMCASLPFEPGDASAYSKSGLPPVDEMFSSLVDQTQDYAIFTMDMEGTIVTWNKGAQALFGFSPQEAIGRDTSMIFLPEDRKAQVPEQEIHLALLNGRAIDERWHLRKDGSRFYADGMMLVLQDSLGKAQGFYKIVQDGAVKLKLREALASKEHELEQLRRLSSSSARISSDKFSTK
jgi:PAS domain S-box-containing protein